MKVTTEELEQCEVLLTVEVEPKQERRMLEKAGKKIAREVRIPGFRPGKAPYSVIVRRFGAEAVQQEALEAGADKIVQDALEEAGVEPFARINLESITWDPLTLKVKVPVEPKVELADYKDIRFEFEPVEVTDEDVDGELELLQDRYATWVPVERPAEIGDLVSMSIVEKDGDEVLSEEESVERELEDPSEHEGHDHPDMTTPIVGLSADEEKTFTVEYSDEYHDEKYAGKEITVEVAVSRVKAKEKDPLDDEFAKTVSDFDTLDELKEDIRKGLDASRRQQQNAELGNKAIDQLIEESTIEWPKAFEDESVMEELQRYERQMQSYGLNIDTYLQMQNKSPEEFTEEIREQITGQLQRTLVLGEIVKNEEIEVSEGEVLQRAKLISDYSGGDDQIWRNILASPSQKAMLSSEIATEKALQWLAASVKGEDPAEAIKADDDDESEVETAKNDEVEAVVDVEDADTGDESSEDDAPQAEPEEADVEPEAVEETEEETTDAS